MSTRMTAMQRNYHILTVFETMRRNSVQFGHGDYRRDLSMRDVAFWGNIKPSSYLKRKLDEAVRAGWLERSEYPYRTSVVAHLYKITDAGIALVASVMPERASLL